MLHCIAMSAGTKERSTFCSTGRTLFRDLRHVVEFLLQLENKQQIMPKNVETQHKHMH